jgi:hypothetical protein
MWVIMGMVGVTAPIAPSIRTGVWVCGLHGSFVLQDKSSWSIVLVTCSMRACAVKYACWCRNFSALRLPAGRVRVNCQVKL